MQNAAVELTNSASQVKSAAVTNTEGLFVFPSVPPGLYDLDAKLAGFSTARIEAMALEVGQAKEMDIRLTPGELSESVTVFDQAPLLGERADRGTVVENEFVASIPLLTRNPLLLVTITAGAIGGLGATPAGDNTVSENNTNAFRINGAAPGPTKSFWTARRIQAPTTIKPRRFPRLTLCGNFGSIRIPTMQDSGTPAAG